ncbi:MULTISPECIES: DUF7742 family protein [unclassified Leisingera]|uniref:DUF7742 family protein n=1 Tax=unclassified Leisingera TaxID=2614906 RepID=UPI001011B6D5|nr:MULTISPECIES: hypothetical protein [unclassified Leisingera]MBQ4823385.1 hypothetical protein [Leisingera sp. HS039]QAX29755.1 hypothetical protein ETW24_10465 [Leisingera sp. NJS204]QBR36484.1 hypothetical protein ETW23_10335 [Leisingera sp. NJS201]
MRFPVLPGDVSAVARALLAVPENIRLHLCRRILGGAAEAAAHCRLMGRLHPRWGDGSLSAAARRFALAAEPFLDDPEYLSCTRLVLRELAAAMDAERSAPAR